MSRETVRRLIWLVVIHTVMSVPIRHHVEKIFSAETQAAFMHVVWSNLLLNVLQLLTLVLCVIFPPRKNN